MDEPIKLAKAVKHWDPHYGMLASKSTGDPLLDRISVAMAEHNHAKDTHKTLGRMAQALPVAREVRLHFGLSITGPAMTPVELEQHLIKDNPHLQEALDGDDGDQIREYLRNQVVEQIQAGQNRLEEDFQVSFAIPVTVARDIARKVAEHAPKTNPGKAAQALRALADEVEKGQ